MRYKKAPIVEAVIEVRWASFATMDMLLPALSGEGFQPFEEPKPRHRIEATFDTQSQAFSYSTDQLGFEAATKDGSQRYLIERDRFAFILTAPYDHWEAFCARFFEVAWPAFELLKIDAFTRIGVRFVNRIDVPVSGDGLPDTNLYLNLSVEGPQAGAGGMKEFQLRVVKHTEDPNILFGLTVANTGSPLPRYSGLLLDIDAFTEQSITVDREELNAVLDALRQTKNHIFEACITDETRAIFGGREE